MAYFITEMYVHMPKVDIRAILDIRVLFKAEINCANWHKMSQ